MIVVCKCGQKSRVRDFTATDRLRCGACKTMLKDTVIKQATRNADIVLELTAYLFNKHELTWTKEEEIIARIIHAHQNVA